MISSCAGIPIILNLWMSTASAMTVSLDSNVRLMNRQSRDRKASRLCGAKRHSLRSAHRNLIPEYQVSILGRHIVQRHCSIKHSLIPTASALTSASRFTLTALALIVIGVIQVPTFLHADVSRAINSQRPMNPLTSYESFRPSLCKQKYDTLSFMSFNWNNIYFTIVEQ